MDRHQCITLYRGNYGWYLVPLGEVLNLKVRNDGGGQVPEQVTGRTGDGCDSVHFTNEMSSSSGQCWVTLGTHSPER